MVRKKRFKSLPGCLTKFIKVSLAQIATGKSSNLTLQVLQISLIRAINIACSELGIVAD